MLVISRLTYSFFLIALLFKAQFDLHRYISCNCFFMSIIFFSQNEMLNYLTFTEQTGHFKTVQVCDRDS